MTEIVESTTLFNTAECADQFPVAFPSDKIAVHIIHSQSTPSLLLVPNHAADLPARVVVIPSFCLACQHRALALDVIHIIALLLHTVQAIDRKACECHRDLVGMVVSG